MESEKKLQELVISADACDLSWSIGEQAVDQRALIGWHSENASCEALEQFALKWGMHLPMVASWRKDAETADGVGLTFNQQLTSLRLYTHSWNRVAPDEIGTVVYRGYKCLPSGSVRIDEYQNFGDLRAEENIAFAKSLTNRPEWIDYVLEVAPDDVPLIFTRTINSGRQSWLATVRHAEIDAGKVAGADFDRCKLMHLAGGVDAEKGSFDTFYTRSSATGVSRFIESWAR